MTKPQVKTIRLRDSEWDLLREVVVRRAPQYLLPLRPGNVLVMSVAECERVQQLLGDELVHSGLGQQDEANARGIALEALIDRFSPYG